LGFAVGIFHFLTEKVNFILPFGLEANFHVTVWSLVSKFHITVRPRDRTGFHITVPEFFASGEYSPAGSFARPLININNLINMKL
jgi:hypothetical protein